MSKPADPQTIINTEPIEAKLEYYFSDKNLLLTALTTPAYAEFHKISSYKNLEWIGDAALELIVRAQLIKNNPNTKLSNMTGMKEKIVNNETLGKWGFEWGLDQYVLKLETQQVTINVMADVVEAICAAVFMDSLNPMHTALTRIIFQIITWAVMQPDKINLKGDVIRHYQTKFKKSPNIILTYREVNKQFSVASLRIDERLHFQTDFEPVHLSKRDAERDAFIRLKDEIFEAIDRVTIYEVNADKYETTTSTASSSQSKENRPTQPNEEPDNEDEIRRHIYNCRSPVISSGIDTPTRVAPESLILAPVSG